MRTLEEKKLLVNAICEYAPYNPLIANEDIDSGFPTRIHPGHLGLSRFIEGYGLDSEIYGEYKADKTVIYLRPIESITDEEKEFICNKCCIQAVSLIGGNNGSMMPLLAVEWLIDWYRENLIDYRGLIKKGIAKPIGTERRWLSTETLKKTTEIIENTIKETKKIIEDGQKKNRRVKR